MWWLVEYDKSYYSYSINYHFMGLFEWGEKRFARGIAKAMIRSYNLHKEFDPNLSELGLVKKTLLDRQGEPAKKLLADLEDENFWKSTVGDLFGAIYLLVRLEYAEYMKGSLESEDVKTITVFKDTILKELSREG
jgi:hypothetical protein